MTPKPFLISKRLDGRDYVFIQHPSGLDSAALSDIGRKVELSRSLSDYRAKRENVGGKAFRGCIVHKTDVVPSSTGLSAINDSGRSLIYTRGFVGTIDDFAAIDAEQLIKDNETKFNFTLKLLIEEWEGRKTTQPIDITFEDGANIDSTVVLPEHRRAKITRHSKFLNEVQSGLRELIIASLALSTIAILLSSFAVYKVCSLKREEVKNRTEADLIVPNRTEPERKREE